MSLSTLHMWYVCVCVYVGIIGNFGKMIPIYMAYCFITETKMVPMYMVYGFVMETIDFGN
jgi:hypothetical protein